MTVDHSVGLRVSICFLVSSVVISILDGAERVFFNNTRLEENAGLLPTILGMKPHRAYARCFDGK